MADELIVETTTSEVVVETTSSQAIEVLTPGPQGPATSVYETDLEITDPERGLILRDGNGTRYRLTLDTAGVLTVTAL